MRAALTLMILALLLGCKQPITQANVSGRPPTWDELVTTDGCLVGQQNSIDALGEGTCLRNPKWQSYISSATPETIQFLCDRLSSTQETSVHTCPFQSATEGELALYTLQHITKKLWRDYSGDNEALRDFIDTDDLPEDQSATMIEQSLIWNMLKNPSFVASMQAYFVQ